MTRTVGQIADAIPEHDEAEARLMTHSYDGIREYDNPLPSWWRMFFVGTIVFAGFYGLYFHVVGWGTSVEDSYRAALASYDDKRDVREQANLANISEESLEQFSADGKIASRGAEVFAIRCASCHGPQGAGLIGPNLTDTSQIHGARRVDIYRTVNGGASGTAMLAWGEQMAHSDVVAAAAFAINLRGRNLRGKPPDGQPVGPFSP